MMLRLRNLAQNVLGQLPSSGRLLCLLGFHDWFEIGPYEVVIDRPSQQLGGDDYDFPPPGSRRRPERLCVRCGKRQRWTDGRGWTA